MVPEDLRSYEQRRAHDPMTVLEDDMSDKALYVQTHGGYGFEPATSIGPLPDKPTPDQQIRMKALECATRVGQGSSEVNKSSWAIVKLFEDYIKNGRK